MGPKVMMPSPMNILRAEKKLREVFFGKHSQGQGGRAGAIEDDKSCYRAEPAKGEKKKKE